MATTAEEAPPVVGGGGWGGNMVTEEAPAHPAHPVVGGGGWGGALDLDKDTIKNIGQEATRLLETLKALAIAGTKKEGDANPLSSEALKACKGYVIMQSHKGSVGVSLESGQGILIKVLEDGKLSAPLMLRFSKLGVGLQLGVEKFHTMMLLMKDSQVEAFTKTDITLGQDLVVMDFHGGESGGVLKEHVEAKARAMSLGPKIISVSENFVPIALSVSGGIVGPEVKLIEAAYGPSVKPAQVLDGSIPVPMPFEPVYSFLTTMIEGKLPA